MENIKRKVMLLKSADKNPAASGGSGGTLKLQSFKEGVSVYFRSESLMGGSYGLYLFISGGRELKDLYVGEIKGREFYSTLYGASIDNIKGAAVISSDTKGAYNFVLKSTGPEWPKIIEHFKIAKQALQHSARTDNTAASSLNYMAKQDDSYKDAQKEVKNIEKQRKFKEIEAEEVRPYIEPVVIKEDGIEENGCDECMPAGRQERTNPFPAVFPDSEWVKISFPGPSGWWHYISGKIFRGSEVAAKVLGVPGEYGMAPPVWLEGFGTYLRAVEGEERGYWLMFQDAETGEVLDMDLSQHGW